MAAERVSINGISYLVCAQCRRALTHGYSPCYRVPEPGNVAPDPWKQALCGPDYRAQYRLTYPGASEPAVDDGYALELPEPIPYRTATQKSTQITTDLGRWEQALQIARESHGAETVLEAYNRLNARPDIEVTGPGAA